uniref:C2H2-type domain-containing protein n=1 Tax=viral metagenome TaxID=1070528 RepID=A0A6C0K249_9ZZZZ
MIPNAKTPETATKFFCTNCDFKCCKESDFNRHNTTRKHIIRTNPNAILTKKSAEKNFTCNCGKNYKHMSSLCNHKKMCNFQEPINDASTEFEKPSSNVIFELLKQNQEFKELIIEQNKQMMEKNMENQKLQQQLFEIASKVSSTTNTNTNCHNSNSNNQFNLQFFLNETCKDALNLTDFVEQIKLQLSDLDMIGRVGYVEGITKIFLRNLKDIDVCKRPIHCSDLKRETMYVKDKDAWEKENNENVKIKRAIKEVEHKNIKQLPQWREENPAAEDTDTKKHMEYQNILLEAMGGSTMENDDKKREKIIRNIAKEVIIDKTT